ncbi:MAG: hypothetical protein KC482_14745, partial [Dehalococcoidia bacterium]|nr:hypothetical protein [Dehalococcoidia bacterium]
LWEEAKTRLARANDV